jgi:hypothetical protein
MVPRGAENGANRLASRELRIAPDCTDEANDSPATIAKKNAKSAG